MPVCATEILAPLTHAYIGLGETEFALRVARRAVESAQKRGSRLFEFDAQLALARALRHASGVGELSAIEQALEVAEARVLEVGARAKQPFLHLERAALARSLGQVERRREQLEQARRLFASIGAAEHAARVKRQLSARSP
jgi:hypothetical protein